ncbi:MAG: aspartate--tRNA ligase [Nanoarchaeota archaeon]
MLRDYNLGEVNEKVAGKKVKLCGWIDTLRVHGKVAFIDLRDRYGKVQCVIVSKNKNFDKIIKLNKESCLLVKGEVNIRPKGSENKDLSSGRVELFVDDVEILNECKEIPFEINDNLVNEELRLKYRFLDLRNDNLKKNIILRSNFIKSVRDFMIKENFVEIETPILAKSTPEGARDYLVPSRIHRGKFYALPQSPQLYKQLLMVSGFDKYFQISRCFRDEDLRSDRQPEFTQIDAEMSFVEEEDIFNVVERMIKYVIKETFNIDIKIPFPRISYNESIRKYKSDKPDLRKDRNNTDEFSFLWVVNFPMFEYSEEEKKFVAAHHPFCMPDNVENLDKNPIRISAKSYDLVLNGVELLSGSIRIHKPEIQKKVFKLLGLSDKEIEEKFGFLLDSFSYGAPPHGGFAIGVDRLVQIFTKANSIRETLAFPKNKEAREVMLDSPSYVDKKQLKEVHIDVVEDKKIKRKKYG